MLLRFDTRQIQFYCLGSPLRVYLYIRPAPTAKAYSLVLHAITSPLPLNPLYFRKDLPGCGLSGNTKLLAELAGPPLHLP
jgi:hypothetical protein